MPEVDIQIGGRSFEVSCEAGQEPILHAAAKMLDTEAGALASQLGRLPEARMLLMAGLMLANKTSGLEQELRQAQDALVKREAELTHLRNAPAPMPERVEVPVVPSSVTDTLAEIAARAEALAETVDGKRAG